MLNGSLRDLVLHIEKSSDLDMTMWLSVSGSLISGRLVSHRKMVQVTTEAFFGISSIADQAMLSIETDSLVEKEQEFNEGISNIEYLHMVDVIIFHGDKLVRSPFAIVDMDLIGVWGIGNVAADQ